jgi:DNA-binding response OmpR family regulator
MQRILVIDDTQPVTQALRRDFAAAGYVVELAASGESGLAAIHKHTPDLVVLDRARADIEGVQLLQRLRAIADQVPVLLLVPDSVPADEVRWLDSGADDCVALTLPFEVVLARTRALLRRRPPPQQLIYADLVIDPISHTVFRGERQIVLTNLEFRLLYEFVQHAERILSKVLLRDRVWGADFGGSLNVVEVYVKQVRQKLEAAGEPRLLHTIRRAGYILRRASSTPTVSPVSANLPPSATPLG